MPFQLGTPVAVGSTVKVPVPVLPFTTLAVDPGTGLLAIPLRLVFGSEAVAQRVRSRFRFFLGEWFLDTRQGIDYFRAVLVKNPSIPLITGMFREVLLTTPGVISVKAFSIQIDRPGRALTATFEAKLNDGSILTWKNEPFIIGAGQ